MPCDSAQHEADHGESQEGQGYPRKVLEVLGEAAAAPQPSEGALDDPALGQHLEPLGGVGAFDDFQVPRPEFPHRRRRGRSLIAAIGEDPLDERKQATDLLQHWQRTVAVLDVGGLDVGRQDQAERIDDDVPLLTLDLLARVVARRVDPRLPFSAPLTLWLSMIAAVGLASFPAISRTSTNKAWWMRARVPSHSHSPRYSCTVLLGGRSLGSARHWQPVIST